MKSFQYYRRLYVAFPLCYIQLDEYYGWKIKGKEKEEHKKYIIIMPSVPPYYPELVLHH